MIDRSELVVGSLPEGNGAAWRRGTELRDACHGDEREEFPRPWVDGPMIGNFAHGMGVLSSRFGQVGAVLPFVVTCAHSPNLIVALARSGENQWPGSPGRAGGEETMVETPASSVAGCRREFRRTANGGLHARGAGNGAWTVAIPLGGA